jgi:hypothetical protein
MASNNALMIAAAAAAAWYFLFNKGSGPTYYNVNKQVITSIKCGNTIIFDVPGHSMVWLTRSRNGTVDFDGLYAVPIPPYILNCSNDVGTYHVTAYTINPDNSKGALIGSTTFTVTPSI